MKKFLFFISLISFVLVSCQKPQSTIETQTPTVVPIQAVRPTITSRPGATPFLTPAVEVYQIPQWLKQSKDDVLMFVDSKTDYSTSPNNFHTIIFLDVDNGEQFNLDFTNFNFAFWLDRYHVGFLHGDSCETFKYGSVVDLTTGEVSVYKASGLPYKNFCPKNKLYDFSVSVNSRENETPIDIYNRRSKVWEKIIPLNSNIKNINAVLSPDNSIIVVLQDINNDYIGDQFAFYDFPSRQLKATFSDSSIQQRFTVSSDKKVLYIQEHTPCILTIETLSKNCGKPMPKFYDLGVVNVSQDNTKLFLQGAIRDGERKVCIEDLTVMSIVTKTPNALMPSSKVCDVVGLESGICVYDFTSGEISCPTRNLEFLKSKTSIVVGALGNAKPVTTFYFVSDFLPSLDETYIVFSYSSYIGYGLSRGIININSREYYDLGEHFGTYEVMAEWRPTP